MSVCTPGIHNRMGTKFPHKDSITFSLHCGDIPTVLLGNWSLYTFLNKNRGFRGLILTKD